MDLIGNGLIRFPMIHLSEKDNSVADFDEFSANFFMVFAQAIGSTAFCLERGCSGIAQDALGLINKLVKLHELFKILKIESPYGSLNPQFKQFARFR